MVSWNNLDTLSSYKELADVKPACLTEVMSGDNGAERVKNYSVPMAAGLSYNYASKQINENVLAALEKLADEAQLADKFKALYNGEVVNTGEKRLVLHHMTRGQLGDAVEADGVDKRTFYKTQQERIAEFANKVHNGEITNASGEKFTTVVQIGIGGSDLGPRAMYIALENWAKKNDAFKMEAKFISNVDPDDAAAVLASTDVAHSIFVLVSKSGTTLETLTNESFVKDALKKAGLDPSKHMIAVTSETSPLAKSALLDRIAQIGAVVVNDSYADVTLAGQPLRIGGTMGHGFAFGRTAEEFAASPEYVFLKAFENTELPKICLAHMPDTFIFNGAYTLWDVDLVLSGHTHGGLVRLPFIGGLYAPMQGLFPKYDRGYFQLGTHMQMVITSGLAGHGLLPRVNNLPEIVVIDLVPQN